MRRIFLKNESNGNHFSFLFMMRFLLCCSQIAGRLCYAFRLPYTQQLRSMCIKRASFMGLSPHFVHIQKPWRFSLCKLPFRWKENSKNSSKRILCLFVSFYRSVDCMLRSVCCGACLVCITIASVWVNGMGWVVDALHVFFSSSSYF